MGGGLLARLMPIGGSDQRALLEHRGLRVGDGLKLLVVNLHQVHGILGNGHAGGDHDHDRLALEDDLVGGQGAAVPGTVVLALKVQVRCGIDADDTRQPGGLLAGDAHYPGVGVLAEQQAGMQHAGELHIAGISGGPRHLPFAVDALRGLLDRCEPCHLSVSVLLNTLRLDGTRWGNPEPRLAHHGSPARC